MNKTRRLLEVTYVHKEKNKEEYWFYWCNFYLYKGKNLCILMGDDDGNRYINYVEQTISSELFPQFLIDRFSSIDYYEKSQNNGVFFDDMYEDILYGVDGDYEYIGNFDGGILSIDAEYLNAFDGFFKPLIDYFEHNSLAKKELWEEEYK